MEYDTIPISSAPQFTTRCSDGYPNKCHGWDTRSYLSQEVFLWHTRFGTKAD